MALTIPILTRAAAFAAAISLLGVSPSGANAGTYDLTIGKTEVNITGRPRTAMTVNGQLPGPVLRFKEGEEVTLNVKNTLDEDTSIHWHGIILPYTQDGVPGISFPGIKPGETFTYRFKINQAGTYWYHSHSGLQEQAGVYGPLVIESAKREPYKYDREYVVMLSDWSDTKAETILSNLKKQSDYYNYSQRTLGTFFSDVAKNGFSETVSDRLSWGQMRMAPTDIADVSGYTYLINGQSPAANWTALFRPGERVRLRFINGSAMSYFDVRIPGLKMTVVQADGNDIQPKTVDQFRIAVAETYDVIVQPKQEQAYTIFAASLARTGYAAGTLAPREGMRGEIPKLGESPILTMADMGMSMDHGSMAGMDHSKMAGMDHSKMQGMDHSKMTGMEAMGGDDGVIRGDNYAPGSGLSQVGDNDGTVLVYGDLKSMKPDTEYRTPDRVIELRLTGNMERYFWSINGKKYSEAEPIRLRYGERVRFKFINETMMSHPMHLHGMWMHLDTGNGRFNPLKHTVNVAPGTTLSVDVPADAMGQWAFHCHLIYHMATGMFRKVIVEQKTASAN